MANKTIPGKQFKNICLIWHSAWWRVIDNIAWKVKNDKDINLKAIIIDGTYGPRQWEQVAQLGINGKIYYVPNTTTQKYALNKWWISIPWQNHMSIIPYALKDAGILSA